MRTAARRRWAFLGVAVAAAPSACSVLVTTDGLSDTGAFHGDSGASRVTVDGRAPFDAPVTFLDGGAPAFDAGPAIDASGASAPADTGASAPGVDATAPGSGHDAGTTATDAGHDAGTRDAADASPAPVNCGGDLSNIGAGDFHVTFGVRTTQSGRAALLNQRAACASGTFWDVRLSSGLIEVETDDGVNATDVTSTGPDLNDGASHTVIVARVAGTITISVDGAAKGSAASKASLGALPALASGTDVCDGRDGTVAFQGTLSGVCVTNH